LHKIKVTNKINHTNVQHSSSSCKGASGVLQITGSNTVISAVLDAGLCRPYTQKFFTLIIIKSKYFNSAQLTKTNRHKAANGNQKYVISKPTVRIKTS